MDERVRPWWPLLPALLLWVPLALVITPVRVPTWLGQAAVAGSAALLVLVVLTSADAPAARRPLEVRALALRSTFGAVALGVATLLHVAAGGGAPFVPDGLFVAAATVLGALLGPLSVFEAHAAARPASRRGDALAAVFSGWAVFLGLCVGWVQGRYVKEVLAAGHADAALKGALDGAWWLLEDPLWTLQRYAWAALPGAACAWSRLRGWPLARQVALGLSLTGAVWWLFPGHIPAVTFGLSTLAIGLPVIAWAADRVAARWPVTADEPAPATPSRAWRAAIALCLLSVIGLTGRGGYRVVERARLAPRIAERTPGWWALTAAPPVNDGEVLGVVPVDGDDLARLRARCAALEEEVAASQRAIDAARVEVADLSERVRRSGGDLSWLHRREGDLFAGGRRGDLQLELQEASKRHEAVRLSLEGERARLDALTSPGR